MKTLALRLFPHLFALAAMLVVAPAGIADDAVTNPGKRTEDLAKGKAVLTAKASAVGIKDPFHSATFQEALGGSAPVGPAHVEIRPTTGPRSSRDLLQAIATSLKPSGFFILGGEPTLVFGQKRVKAGGTLTIRFEEKDYALEIVSIERPNFTLRLNGEDFTRPIK